MRLARGTGNVRTGSADVDSRSPWPRQVRVASVLDSMTKRRVLLTGSTGYLGRHLVAELRRRGEGFTTLGRTNADRICDLGDLAELRRHVAAVRPTHVVHAGAVATLAACEGDEDRAFAVNASSMSVLSAQADVRVVLVSTDLVFDGEQAPYDEARVPAPRSAYGRTKAAAERMLLTAGAGLVVRVPLLFGKSFDGVRGATDMIRSKLAQRASVVLFADEWRSPLHVVDAAHGLIAALFSERNGVLHLPGPKRVTRAEFGLRFCALQGLDGALLSSGLRSDPGRPRDVSLSGSWTAGRSLDAMLRDS